MYAMEGNAVQTITEDHKQAYQPHAACENEKRFFLSRGVDSAGVIKNPFHSIHPFFL
jgi:hypothetical protein